MSRAFLYTILILSLLPFSCKKTSQPAPAPPKIDSPLSHTIEMAGTHLWIGTIALSGNSKDTSYARSQSGYLDVIDDSTISLTQGIKPILKYFSSDTTSKMITFVSYWNPGSYNEIIDSIRYDYRAKTIYFYEYENFDGHISIFKGSTH